MLDDAVDLVRAWTRGSREARHPVFPDVTARRVRARIHGPLPRRASSAKAILAAVRTRILPSLRDNGHPRFFGYVMSPPSAPGVVADLITSAIDQNVTAWRSAPAATEVERVVIEWLRRIAGMPAGTGGILTSGGSMATFTALAAARARHQPEAAHRDGLGAIGRRLMTIYASEECHMSVPRAALLLGLGARAVRLVPVDARFRIDPRALDEAIVRDRRAGHLPFCVVASAGTVNTGAVDPLDAVGRIARRHRCWFHVDAAYGGPLRLARTHRARLDGIGSADSIALDPHKWLYAPLDAGCVLFRNPDTPRAAFPTPGDYARVIGAGDRESHIFFDSSPELSRRFRALKVWMILKYHGIDRIGRRIGEECRLARHLGAIVDRHDETELLAPVETGIVCFRYRPAGGAGREDRIDAINERLLLALQRAGRVYLSNARIRGRFALRACLINFRTTRADLDEVLEEVVATGRKVSR